MDSKENKFGNKNMKISDRKKKRIWMLREEGCPIQNSKGDKRSVASVIKIIKFEESISAKVLSAWVYKIMPKSENILIHFGDKEKWAKCVVKAGIFNTPGKPLKVKKVETTDEELYRQV